MWIMTFFLLAIAIALGVHRWLKIHENPESLTNLLELIWLLVKFLLMIWAVLLVLGWIWYWLYIVLEWIFDWIASLDIWITFPKWIWEYVPIIVILGVIVACCWLNIKEKWWFKKWLQFKKESRIKRKKAKKEMIAKMTKEELKEYKKSKRPWIWFRLLIAFPSIILILAVVGLICRLFTM